MAPRTPTMAATKNGRDLGAELSFLTRALKAPTLREAIPRLADRARAESWTHEEFLVACLQREVSARESHGGEGRIRAARFPARKSLEEFDFDHARGLKRRISDALYPQLLTDARTADLTAAETGPGGHRGASHESSAAGSHPHTGTSDQPLPGPAQPTLPAPTPARKSNASRRLEPAS